MLFSYNHRKQLGKNYKAKILASFGIMPDMRKFTQIVVMKVYSNVNVLHAFTLYLVCLITTLRGKKLSDSEQIKTLTLNEAGMSGSNTARKIGKFKTAINSFFRNPEDYGTNKRTGRPKSLTERRSMQIRKLAYG